MRLDGLRRERQRHDHGDGCPPGPPEIRRVVGYLDVSDQLSGYSVSGSRVRSSCARPTPRRANRPTDTSAARCSAGSAAANADDTRTGQSTERHIDAMRLVSLTAGPTTVKSSRSVLPMLP